jgi:hypothetical protein
MIRRLSQALQSQCNLQIGQRRAVKLAQSVQWFVTLDAFEA